jgi:predicted NBD/HSP70 family sugar kinase
MGQSIGLILTDHFAAGVVSSDHKVSRIRAFPSADEDRDSLFGMPTQDLVDLLAGMTQSLAVGAPVDAVGIGLPGVVREGVIEDSPNLSQLKGLNIQEAMRASLAARGITDARIRVCNDADAVATGVAALQKRLNKITRVWTIGTGVGFGHFPIGAAFWESGHSVVSLDPNERYCGCGGQGHLEGILGYRAMRMRFLDLEPEEVFQLAESGEDARCVEFRLLWHKALAAATASSIHMEGPGHFYFTGPSVKFLNLQLLGRFVQDMVKMSPMLNYHFEIVPEGSEAAIVGAAVNAGL